ncbi:MAG: SH3 domain-containing protein [Oscillospiraceae bacterium]|nr:SH3 domain-containing protein [Oscillospiraceae bacterium]
MKRYGKILASVVLAVALTVGLCGNAFAYTGPATVATDNLNLREGGSLDYNVIDCLPRGARVTINFDAGYGWYQVTYKGQTGYIAGYYLLLGDYGPDPDAPAQAEAPAAETPAAAEPVQEIQTAPQAQQTQEAQTSQTVTIDDPVAYIQPVNEINAAGITPAGSGTGSICGNEVRLRSGPSMNSETVAFLYSGNAVNVHGACGKWYEVDVNGNVGYVYGDYVLLSGQEVTYTMTVATTIDNTAIYTEPVTEETYVAPAPVTVTSDAPAETPAPAANPVTVTSTAPQNNSSGSSHNASAGQAIVDAAMQYIGTPYVWGGESLAEGGFDCSGLVYAAYGQNGIKLNRVAQAMYYNGEAVDLNNLQPGDVLLFGSSVYNIWHAGIYVGNGVYVHSPYSGATVRTQTLSSTYGMNLVAARRLV